MGFSWDLNHHFGFSWGFLKGGFDGSQIWKSVHWQLWWLMMSQKFLHSRFDRTKIAGWNPVLTHRKSSDFSHRAMVFLSLSHRAGWRIQRCTCSTSSPGSGPIVETSMFGRAKSSCWCVSGREFSGMIHHSSSGWWFGTFFIFPYIGINHPNWLSYFSEGWPNHQPVMIISATRSNPSSNPSRVSRTSKMTWYPCDVFFWRDWTARISVCMWFRWGEICDLNIIYQLAHRIWWFEDLISVRNHLSCIMCCLSKRGVFLGIVMVRQGIDVSCVGVYIYIYLYRSKEQLHLQ